MWRVLTEVGRPEEQHRGLAPPWRLPPAPGQAGTTPPSPSSAPPVLLLWLPRFSAALLCVLGEIPGSPGGAPQHSWALKPLLRPHHKQAAFLGTPVGPRASHLRAGVYLPPNWIGSFWKARLMCSPTCSAQGCHVVRTHDSSSRRLPYISVSRPTRSLFYVRSSSGRPHKMVTAIT